MPWYRRAAAIVASGLAVVLVVGLAMAVSARRQQANGTGPATAGRAAAADAGSEPTGTIVSGSAPSPALHGTIEYQVYLPAGYAHSQERYPTLYLLHGRGDTMAAWTREKADLDRLIASGSVAPFIVVMPDAPWSDRGSWYVDSRYRGSDYPGQPVETALTKDLVAHVDATYRTMAQRQSRAVGGYSMGGAGALRFLLAHPDEFAAGIVLSPAVYTPEPPADSSTRDYGAFGVGGARFVPARYRQLNYPNLLRKLDPALPLHVFLAVGDDEYVNPKRADANHDLDFETAVAYNALKRVPGITAEFRELDGGHNWDVWQPAFVQGLTDINRYLTTGREHPPMDAALLGSSGDDWAGGTVPTSDGGVTVALGTSGSLVSSSAGGLDVAVIRQRADGTREWAVQFGTDGDDRPYGMAPEADGGVLVAGYTSGDLDGRHPGASGDDAFVARLEADGSTGWVMQFGDPAQADRVYAISPDGSGGAYLAGYTKGSVDGQSANAGDKDVFLARVDQTGNPLWTRQFGSAGEDKGLAVTAFPGGVAVAGVAGDALPGAAAAGGGDGYVAAYDPDGTRLWIRQIGSPAWDLFYGLAATSDGSLVAGGTTEGDLAGASGGTDALAVRLSAAGETQWVRQMGTAGDDQVAGVVPGPDGGAILVGTTTGEFASSVGGDDVFVTPVTSDGTPAASAQFGTSADDGADSYGEPNLFAAAGSERLWVSGVSYGDPAGASNAGSGDVFVWSGPLPGAAP